MSSVALGPPRIEGRISPRTRVEEGGRYPGIPPNGAFQHSRVSRKPGAVHLLVTRAGRLTRIGGRRVLRLSHNPATEALYAELDHRLAA